MTALANRVLLVEDEPRTTAFLERAFRAQALAVTCAATGDEGLARALGEDYDLVVLDLRLPGLSGLAVLEAVRAARPELPVIVLSAQADLDSKLRTFELGAIDFVTKPFVLSELIARMRAHLRRRAEHAPDELAAGPLRLSIARREVRVGDERKHVSESEFRVLHQLVARRGEAVSRQQLLAHAWGYDFDPRSNVVDVSVMRLRRKLGDQVAIETVRNVGYRLACA